MLNDEVDKGIGYHHTLCTVNNMRSYDGSKSKGAITASTCFFPRVAIAMPALSRTVIVESHAGAGQMDNFTEARHCISSLSGVTQTWWVPTFLVRYEELGCVENPE